MVPLLSVRPCRANPVLMAASYWGASWCFSSRWRKHRMVVSPGTRAASSRPAKRRYKAVRAVLPMAGSLRFPPQLQAVDAQHGVNRKWRAATQGLICAFGQWRNESHQSCPVHDLIHLVREDLLAGFLGQWASAQVPLIHCVIALDAGSAEGQARKDLQTDFTRLARGAPFFGHSYRIAISRDFAHVLMHAYA